MQTEFIKTQNLVPGVYTSESRDFQLFCRALDVIVNAVKYDVDSIPNINNTDEIRETVIDLLQTKLGFIPSQHYSTDKLRIILSVVPLLRKYKGCRRGIEYALNAYSKIYQLQMPLVAAIIQQEPVYMNGGEREKTIGMEANQIASLPSDGDSTVDLGDLKLNRLVESPQSGTFVGYRTVNIVRVGLSDKSVDRVLLDDLLHYVLPFGFAIEYYDYSSINFDDDNVRVVDDYDFEAVDGDGNVIEFDDDDYDEK